MSKVSSLFVSRAVRTGLLAVVTALVLVPTIARARQHVEHRDATRLSIKHSWIGVAPPTKASIAPGQTAPVLAPLIVEIGRGHVALRVDPARGRAPRIVDALPFDSPRGPPPLIS
ncbi:MAG TPA: hypothetical protein VKB36_20005 [Vicinamibacterales bacterium]|nr:hypothetical protein [Vicinamibacterales bacterium]